MGVKYDLMNTEQTVRLFFSSLGFQKDYLKSSCMQQQQRHRQYIS